VPKRRNGLSERSAGMPSRVEALGRVGQKAEGDDGRNAGEPV